MLAKDLKPLTSLRFFAALAIVLLHAKLYTRWEWLAPLQLPLGQGVSFFFVLSGFILSHVYGTGPAVGFARFLQLRIARLWPVHAFTLLVAATFVDPAAFDGAGIFSRGVTFFANITLTQSLFPFPAFLYSWNGVSWSLSTEMGFYLVFPLLLPLLPRFWPFFLILPIGILAGAGYVMETSTVPLAGDNAYTFGMSSLLYAHPLARMPEFCLGMVTFHLWHRWLKEKRWHCLIWSSLELALLSVGWSWISHDYWVFMTGFRSSWFTYWLGMAGSCWLFAALIAVLAYGTGIVGRLLSVRPLVWAGKVSFALYMVHQIVFKIMVWRWDITSSRVLLPCVLAAAAIVHYVIERPSQRTIAGLDVRRARVIEFSDTR